MKVLWAIVLVAALVGWFISRKYVIKSKEEPTEKSKKTLYYVICYGTIVLGLYAMQQLFL